MRALTGLQNPKLIGLQKQLVDGFNIAFFWQELEAQGYEVTYVEYAGGHDLLWGGMTLANGLRVLLNVHCSTS